MPTNNQNWMKSKKEIFNWYPTGPTLKDISGAIGQGINNIAGYFGGVENKTFENIGQVSNQVASGVARTLGNIGQAESKATLPAREAALEAAWRIVQQGNYFFGFPYSTGSYKDAISAFSQKNGGALPPGPHTQGVDPATVLPFLSNLPPDPLQRGPGAQVAPAQPTQPTQGTQPTQAEVNQQWMRYWNNQGPRPAAGTVYKP